MDQVIGENNLSLIGPITIRCEIVRISLSFLPPLSSILGAKLTSRVPLNCELADSVTVIRQQSAVQHILN